MRWMCVSLLVDDELSEPVSDILRRYAPDGVALETTEIVDDELSGHPADTYILKAYLPENDGLQAIIRKLQTDLGHLSLIRPVPEPVFSRVEEQDWNALWKEKYRPVPAGKSLLIQPAWLPRADTDRNTILLDPGMAFGTGTHPTTRLCIEAMENVLEPGQSVVDLGCGSGILSIAAVLLGAGSVSAFDNDPEAVRAACDNIHKNRMEGKIETRTGSLPEMLELSRKSSPDLIVANILAKILIRMLENGLAAALEPGGRLILSGILDHQLQKVLQVSRLQGLVEVQRLQERDWVATTLRKK